MKTDVKPLPRNQVEITVEIPTADYEPFLKQAAQKISEAITIKGFRKGKADFDIIKKHVGEVEIWEKALDPAIQKTLVKVLDEKQYVTVGAPKVDVVTLAPGSPVVYKATISLLPKVTLTDYKKIKVADNKPVVSDADVNKALENLQKMHAKQALVDRAAKLGDRVEIDFETFLDKIPLDNGKQDKFELVLGEGNFIPGFEDHVAGMKKGDEKTFQLKFPKDYHQKNLADKLVDFKVKAGNVYELELPTVSDEFAQALGEFTTAAELKNKIKENLLAEKTQVASRELEEQILEQVITQSKFEDIPDELINAETKKMLEELEHTIGHQGLQFSDYLTHLKKTRDDLLLDFAPQAVKRVKSAIAMREIGQHAGVTVSEAEIDAEVEKTLALYGDNETAKQQLNQPAYRNYLKNILTSQKIIEHLKSVMVK